MDKKEQKIFTSVLNQINSMATKVDSISDKFDIISNNIESSTLECVYDNPEIQKIKEITKIIEFNKRPLNTKKLMVIMASHNSAKTIEMAVNSILNQTHKNIHLCIVDDNSTDDTVAVIERLYGHNSKVSLYKLNNNHGSYVARNVALRENLNNYDYWVLHDSDDFAYPDRFNQLLYRLEESNKSVVNCGFVRKDLYTNEVINEKDNSENSIIYNKYVFKKLGYYDERTRYGGDSEYRNRFYSAFGENELHKTKLILFDAFITGNNCTIINKLDSNARKQYTQQFISEIEKFKLSNDFFRDFTLPTTKYNKIF